MKLYIKQRVFTYKDKFEIRNSFDKVEYRAIGKIIALSKRFNIENSHGKKVAVIKKRIFSIFPQYKIKIVDGENYRLKRKFTFFRHKYKITPLDWELKGDFLDHNYDVVHKNNEIMSIRKKWFKWGDTYELDIPNDDNALICLCIAVAIDAELASDKKIAQEN